MTIVLALVPPQRHSVLHSAPLRLALFDCSVLTSDVIAATCRLPPSSFVAAMESGTVRGFITRQVWAEVPRVLEDRWNESDGAFNLADALRVWWNSYVPLLYTVDTDRLPYTPEAEQLATEDPSDVGMLQLHGVLGPAALIAHDKDLRRSVSRTRTGFNFGRRSGRSTRPRGRPVWPHRSRRSRSKEPREPSSGRPAPPGNTPWLPC